MIKEFKDDGCRFMCKCIPGSVSVFDMDVDDGVEVVEFEGFDDVSIRKVAEKSFPSVKTLVIGEEVDYISIPNKMFPNVRNIISYNRHFLNSDMLIRVAYNILPDKNGKHTDIWLLNTFCKKPDEVINLKSVEFIDDYAFDGCRSTKIINEDCVKGGCQFAFLGSAFMELKPVGGAYYMAGSMIIDVDEDANELVIPDRVRTIGPYAFCSSGLENIHLGKRVKVIQRDALMNTKLKELRFPASVKELQDIGPIQASDVYLESSKIPSCICGSVSETITLACDFDTLHKADSLAQPYVKVHTPKRTVYFPSHILIDTRNELSDFIAAKKDFPENMFPYAINARIRFQIALAECKDLKSMAAEKYLRRNIVDCVREFVNIDEEPALVDLFRMHLVDNVEAFTEILQILPNSMVLAKAYLLNESEKLELDDLSC